MEIRALENAVRQFDLAVQLIGANLRASVAGKPPPITPLMIISLHAEAMSELCDRVGQYRDQDVIITGSKHVSPVHGEVAALVEEMCDSVNAAPENDPFNTAAYVLWRLNWIHPFENGNGRTARAMAFVVLCVGLGAIPPGRRALPERIVNHKYEYIEALETADETSEDDDGVDVAPLAELLVELITQQLEENFGFVLPR